MNVLVIIPAAGLGTRMASAGARGAAVKPAQTSKQFAELAGVPILVHTLRKFAAAPRIKEIFLAMRTAEAEKFRPRLEQEKLGKPVHIVEGGEHLARSVSFPIA